MSSVDINLKRAYETPAPGDGVRILVERLWPRGLTKQDAAIDHWLKDIAPTPELRKWFDHRTERWEEFRQRYRTELAENDAAVDELRRLCGTGSVTFIFAARDVGQNSAVVLREYVLAQRG